MALRSPNILIGSKEGEGGGATGGHGAARGGEQQDGGRVVVVVVSAVGSGRPSHGPLRAAVIPQRRDEAQRCPEHPKH